jgi:glycosyltransferase involved in cell wall biosynthesis
VHSKKVLFIAYLFPPVAGGGVQRSSKFVKYLPHFGWEPIILTVKEPYDFYSDYDLYNEVKENCKIYKTFSIEPMKWVRKIIKRTYQKRIELNNTGELRAKKSLKPEFLVKLKTYLLIPDNEILWLPFAVWRGWRIIKREKPSIIYSTASPYTDHLIALLLKKITHLPWLADFRDLWVDRANFPKNRWRLFIDRKLEAKVLKNADHITTSSPLITARFKELYPADKYTTITNGFDENDFSEAENLEPAEDEFRITYTGIFNKEQDPQKIFQAVKKLIVENKEFKDKIKMRFIGQLDNPGDFENYNLLKRLGLNKYSEIISYQPHQKVIEEMCKASVLLLLVGEYPHSEGIFTGKLFEYLRAKRPILAVVHPAGVASDVIRNTNSGIVVSHANEDEIARGILNLFDMFRRGELYSSFSHININTYSRKCLTKNLSEVFNDSLNNPKSLDITA